MKKRWEKYEEVFGTCRQLVMGNSTLIVTNLQLKQIVTQLQVNHNDLLKPSNLLT